MSAALDDVERVADTLDDADLTLTEASRIGGYTYDEEAVEFKLCVENATGACATHDTAPMSLRESGETGGCPAG